MQIWISTSNKGKLAEFTQIFAEHLAAAKIHSTKELGFFSPPPENGKTYEENARIKAKSLKAIKSDQWVFGEDTGLEVEGLNNLPGLHTARYAGPNAADSENIAKMLKMLQLKQAATRAAKFICCIVAYSPEGKEYIFQDQMKGEIAMKPAGLFGFGYDPILIPELTHNPDKKTLAELEPSYKLKYSHRAITTLKLIELIKTQI